MSTVIVRLRGDANRSEFMQALLDQEIAFTDYPMLPTFFVVEGFDVDTFPLREHTAIESIRIDSPDDFKADQTIVLDDVRTAIGPWGLLRHTRRDKPWPTPFPASYTDEFDCVRTGIGVDVYLIDTGVRTTHDEFGGRATSLDSWTPISTHGTAVAACAAGATFGFARDALIWSAAGLRNADDTGTTPDILAAFNTVIAHYKSRELSDRPAILNMSFTTTATDFQTITATCAALGFILVSSAGNGRTNLDTPTYPANHPEVINAGAINADDGPLNLDRGGTNYGNSVNILAAGQDVLTASFTGDSDTVSISGTSFSSPYVAGICACMMEGYRRPTTALQTQQVAMRLYDDATFGRYVGDPRFFPMTPAIAYLDPGAGPFPAIPLLISNPYNPNKVEVAQTRSYVVIGGTPNVVEVAQTLVYCIIQP
jgi:aqualysin 1